MPLKNSKGEYIAAGVAGGLFGGWIRILAVVVAGGYRGGGSVAGLATGANIAPVVYWSARRDFKRELVDQETARLPGETISEWAQRILSGTEESER